MGTRDPRIDAYIAKSADFARPILEHVREAVHRACPDAEETLKWSMPHFTFRGRILAHMAAFKAHCALGFWNAEVAGGAGRGAGAMGQFGRITSLEELPAKAELGRMVRQQAALIESGQAVIRTPKVAKAALEAPADLVAALKENAAARKTFDAFPPSSQREYVEWVLDAKRPGTRASRIAQAVEWMRQGKRRHWKYQ